MDNDNTEIKKKKTYKPSRIGLYVFMVIVIAFFGVLAFWLLHPRAKVEVVRITFPEGVTNLDMATILSKKLPTFDTHSFVQQTDNLQGQLFPDTYFVYPNATPQTVIQKLVSNFNRKTTKIFATGYKSYTRSQILVMASLVQKEAANSSDAPIIAGILWKRLEMNMPLQVDSSFITYRDKGLPAMPINNPGLVALSATINPQATSYLYYLHDKNGMIHLASSYADHMRNIRMYLQN